MSLLVFREIVGAFGVFFLAGGLFADSFFLGGRGWGEVGGGSLSIRELVTLHVPPTLAVM